MKWEHSDVSFARHDVSGVDRREVCHWSRCRSTEWEHKEDLRARKRDAGRKDSKGKCHGRCWCLRDEGAVETCARHEDKGVIRNIDDLD